jgi:large subunit ribosomal protein L4
VNDQEIFVVDSINFDQPKTKNVVKMLSDFNAEGKALIITADAIENVERSASNIQGVKVITSMGLNVYDLLHYTKIFVAQDAISRIEEVLA